ncbi:hypothetical protein ACFLZH_03270 [Patescibacteria group bacterium]
MVSATAVTLLIVANQAISFNANSLEASWLAQEGVNGFRGLRDTNWIRFSYDKESCWNMVTDNCTPANIMTDASYRIETSTIRPPQLFEETPALDLSDGIQPTDDAYRLYYQADGTVDHDDGGEKSKFFRSIELEIVDPNIINAVCTVAWLQSGDQKTIKLPVIITNFALEE